MTAKVRGRTQRVQAKAKGPDWRVAPSRRLAAFYDDGQIPSILDPEFADAVSGASGPDRLRIPHRAALNECLADLERAVGADEGGDAELVRLEWRSRARRIVVELSNSEWRAHAASIGGRPRVSPEKRRASAVFRAYEYQARELQQQLAKSRSRTRQSLERATPDALRERLIASDSGELLLRRNGHNRRVIAAHRENLSVQDLWSIGLYDLVVALTAAHFEVSPGTIRSLGLTSLRARKRSKKPAS